MSARLILHSFSSRIGPAIDCENDVDRIMSAFEQRLGLTHVERASVESCDGDRRQLQRLAERLTIQTENAKRVFELLDENGKGVVVLQDLQRVASDVMGDGKWEDEDLIGMVQLVAAADGLVTQDDIIRVARKVEL